MHAELTSKIDNVLISVFSHNFVLFCSNLLSTHDSLFIQDTVEQLTEAVTAVIGDPSDHMAGRKSSRRRVPTQKAVESNFLQERGVQQDPVVAEHQVHRLLTYFLYIYYLLSTAFSQNTN